MRICIVLLVVVFSCPSLASRSSNIEQSAIIPLQAMIKHMLINESPDVKKSALKIVFNEKLTSQGLLDFIATQLKQSYKESANIDLMSWYVKALSLSTTDRYSTLISSIYDESSSVKLKKHAEKALKKLNKVKNGVPFSDADISAQVVMIENEKHIKLKEVYEPNFKGFSRSNTIYDVIELLGVPHSVDLVTDVVKISFVGNTIAQKLTLKYKDFANIQLGYNKGCLCVERFYKRLEVSGELKGSKHAHIIDKILNGTPVEYRAAAQKIHREKLFSEEILDSAAKRIWQDKHYKESFSVDGIAWLIKCIQASANPRYRLLLKMTKKKSKSIKVKHYAANALSSLLVDDSVKQFAFVSD